MHPYYDREKVHRFDRLVCLHCLFNENTQGRKKMHTIEIFERDTKLKEAAYERRDEDIVCSISEEDLIAQYAMYHSTHIYHTRVKQA